MKQRLLISLSLILLFTLTIFSFLILQSTVAFQQVSPNEIEFRKIAGINENLVTTLREHPVKKNLIYAGTDRFLYQSQDNGLNWKPVISVNAYINCIYFDNDQNIFVGTDKGLFKKIDPASWKRVFAGRQGRAENVLSVTETSSGILIGTEEGLYMPTDKIGDWKKVNALGNYQITALETLMKANLIYAATEQGLFKSDAELNSWEKVFYLSDYSDNSSEEEIVEVDEVAKIDKINDIVFSQNAKKIFIATQNGVFQADINGRNWVRLTTEGLLNKAVNRLALSSSEQPFAATEGGLFEFNSQSQKWSGLYKGLSTNKVNDIAISSDSGIIFVATSRGLYTSEFNQNVSHSLDVVLENFSNEPSILEVQKQAIIYGEVHPDKINSWRRLAAKKAMLPKVSLDADRYVTDLHHWDAGQNPDVLQRGKDTVQWGVSVSWDLGDLVWSSDQTSIDTRSRLMVQLRQDILDELNRLYFERRRLQVELLKSPPEDEMKRIEKELRLAELSADLDALTGGYFSQSIKPQGQTTD